MRKLFFLLVVLSLNFISPYSYAEEAQTHFALSTTAFLDKGILPVLYTCDGKDISPQLEWINVPANTKTFALIFSDIDPPDGTFYHWVVFNIPVSTTSFDQGIEKLPSGSVAGINDFKNLKYNGPCPPKGSAHTYVFTLYALDTKLTLKEGANAKSVLDAIQNHMLGQAQLTTVYSRWIQ